MAANIWIDRASAGLPLSPHLTSSAFPPKDPVSNNAVVTIDENSNAVVEVPIVIPSKVMSVKSISGLDLVGTSSSGGYLSGITVNLGRVTSPNTVITKGCVVSLDLGELAQQIAKKEKEQVWNATFQVDFSGVPSGNSGGGNVNVSDLMAEAAGEKTAQGTNVRIGVLPEETSAVLGWMMQEHRNDQEIKEKETTPDKTAEMTAESAKKDAYLFTVLHETELDETTADTEEPAADSGENGRSIEDAEGTEKTEAETSAAAEKKTDVQPQGGYFSELSAQLCREVKDKEYDVALVHPEDVAALLEEEAADPEKSSFVVIGMIEYTKESDAEADETSESEVFDTRRMLLIANRTFADAHEKVLTDLLAEAKSSAAKSEKDLEQTAAYAVTFQIAEDASEVLDFLTQYQEYTLSSGVELKEKAASFVKNGEFAEVLGDEALYFIPEKTQDVAWRTVSTDEKAGNTDETESDGMSAGDGSAAGNSEEDQTSGEKMQITDADSLSAALDAALAKKKETEAEITYSNSSNLDLAAERTAGEALTPGTYQVSANLYLPGELNTQLPGTTAYMTNPANPLGIGGHDGIPMTPVEDNAVLTVGEDGTKTVELEVVNPVFTLQEIGSPQNSEILAAVRDEERYEGTNGVGVDGRITKLYIQLGDDGGVYPFDDCHEFPTLLETDWYVVMELSVEFTSAQKISDDTKVRLPEESGK